MSKNKKILYFNSSPVTSGATRSLFTSIKYLDKKKFHAKVIHIHPNYDGIFQLYKNIGVDCSFIPTPQIWNGFWLTKDNMRSNALATFFPNKRIASIINSFSPDLIHINDYNAYSAVATASKTSIPLVWHCRYPIDISIYNTGYMLKKMYETKSDHIITISEPEYKLFGNDKNTMIYNAIELDYKCLHNPRFIREKLNIDLNCILITAPISIGVEHKGAMTLIKAIKLIKNMNLNINMKFLIIGKIPNATNKNTYTKFKSFLLRKKTIVEKTLNLIKEYNLENQIMVHDHTNDIYSFINASDIIVFPSHIGSCGRPCFEGGAFSKPVVVTLPNTNTNVILNNKTGLIAKEKDIYDLAEKIAILIKNKDLRKRLGDKAREYVLSNFSPSIQTQKIMNIYNNLLENTND